MLAQLVAQIARETDTRAALEAIAEGAVRLTASRFAFVAVLNDEAGHLEIQASAGDGSNRAKAINSRYMGNAL